MFRLSKTKRPTGLKGLWRNLRLDLRRGQTIIEVIMATGVVGLVMTAIVAIASVSVRNTAQAKAKTLGTKFSQEAMDYLRQQRGVLGWESFVATVQQDGTNARYCLSTIPTSTAAFQALGNRSCNANEKVDNKGIFTRYADLQIINGTPQRLRVTVTVSWSESGIAKTSTAVQEFRKSVN